MCWSIKQRTVHIGPVSCSVLEEKKKSPPALLSKCSLSLSVRLCICYFHFCISSRNWDKLGKRGFFTRQEFFFLLYFQLRLWSNQPCSWNGISHMIVIFTCGSEAQSAGQIGGKSKVAVAPVWCGPPPAITATEALVSAVSWGRPGCLPQRTVPGCSISDKLHINTRLCYETSDFAF